MDKGLCWELQRDISVSSSLFEVCLFEQAGICSYRGGESCTAGAAGERQTWAEMEGVAGKEAGLGLIKLNISGEILSVFHVGQTSKVSLGFFYSLIFLVAKHISVKRTSQLHKLLQADGF